MIKQQAEQHGGTLTDCLSIIAASHHRAFSRESAIAGLPLVNGSLTPSIFERAAHRAGFTSRVVNRTLPQINSDLLPVILLLHNQQCCVLNRINAEGTAAEVIYPELSDAVVTLPLDELEQKFTGQLIYCRPEFHFDKRAPVSKRPQDKHWFWGVIAESRSLYRDILLAAVMINIFAVAMPLYIMNIYDRVVPNHATDTLWVLSAGVILALVADLVLRLMRSWFVDLAASRADIKLSATIMERVLGMKMQYRPESTGSFVANIQSFEAVRSFTGSLTVIALVDLPFVLLFTLIIALISWPLVLPILAGTVAIGLYALMAQQKMQRLAEASMRAGAMRNATLVESLSNLENVKSFNAQGNIQSGWEKSTIFISRTAAKMRFLSSSISSGALLMQHLVAVIIMITGVYLLIDGQLTQGGLIGAYMLSSRAMGPISQAVGLLAQYHNAATAMQSLNEIMTRPTERPADKHWISRPVLRGNIEFRRASFKYPGADTSALSDVSFKIHAGEHVAIIGKNGSGKSTLERLILGLYEPDSGAVLVDGVDLRQLDPTELRRNIGYVPQDISLFSGSLHDNIITAAGQVRDEQIIRAADISGLLPFINRHPAGFNMPVGEHGQLLSGGQRQAVAIARAVINDPPILLLDEPTGALDHSSEEQLKQKLEQYAPGKTMIIITHRTSLLSLAERIIVIDNGKIVADGQKEAVMEALRQGRIGGAS
ncbi:type I secretion system permease/ATPase [Chromatiaceae bacterium AAb-1]|nr:type I secretion system permease/ATPase [Chromatiaceae bacterium AAb-1]